MFLMVIVWPTVLLLSAYHHVEGVAYASDFLLEEFGELSQMSFLANRRYSLCCQLEWGSSHL
ncbi:MAG: hypothetical protein GXP27_20375 [Planctomycetes bacterium]|nr:hypothetical protein [Planctomycetota bacterium]